MGLLDLLWRSYQAAQEEKANRTSSYDDDSYEDSYRSQESYERPRSSLPPRSARVQWRGYYQAYNSYRGHYSQEGFLDQVMQYDQAHRLCVDPDMIRSWMRRNLPEFEDWTGGSYPRIVEENEHNY